jgi:excisionase family DNA binding protein
VKRRSGIKKGAGRSRGGKPTPSSDVDESAVMTLQQVAEYLHCHYATAYRLARQGKMPCFKLGGEWRVLKSEINKWIAKGGGRR